MVAERIRRELMEGWRKRWGGKKDTESRDGGRETQRNRESQTNRQRG